MGGFVAPECTACGACCTSSSPQHARVTGDDWSRLGEDAERWTEWIGNRAFMRIEHGRCVALEARRDGRFACRIYERRPAVCRELERGSPACDAEITRKAARMRRHLPLWIG
ncbi:YkgJ family cysteine cluster protein [Sandaracinus amylolyticus]|uniref:YkgJ family cysteine cluster protein n=1 Tax=Sandaracinus amylolyticus TaxID=927083 RepID=UPI001F20D86A|nr:YkgJ family cysteine cluster protein [Sandaracinus amylolyticus]UJR78445.1 Flagellin N-methylase [Sandaracinus amylolyticus]